MSKQSDLVSVAQGAAGDPLYIDTTNDRVGVGTTSPSDLLELSGDTAQPAIRLTDADVSGLYHRIFTPTNTGLAISADTGNVAASSFLRFDVDGSERMRIDSSGNLLVGTTDTNLSNNTGSDTGFGVISGELQVARDGGVAMFNRTSTDGTIINFRRDGSTVAKIGATTNPYFVNNTTGGIFLGTSSGQTRLLPCDETGALEDNIHDIGDPVARWDDIYATNGTIQTSDRNEKQDIEALSDAEQRVAAAAKGLLRKYRWKDAVAEKGDTARIHFGIIAQDLQAAFEAEGLDAGRYGMFISSTWWEAEVEKTREVEQEDGTTVTETYTATETYDEPTEGATERTRLGVRYSELLAFIIAAL